MAPSASPSLSPAPQHPPSLASPPIAPRKPLYETSSQYLRWRFTPSGLEDLRKGLNSKAIEAIKRGWEEELRTPSPPPFELGSQGPPDEGSASGKPQSSAPPHPPAPTDYLSPGEEQALVTFYLTKVNSLCKRLQLPELVEATAMTYIKRFYLKNTCMDWHPKVAMLTCLFLAAKTTDCLVPVQRFVQSLGNPVTESEILDMEFLVGQSLRFDFQTHSAHRAAHGIWLDSQTIEPPVSITQLHSLYTSARRNVSLSRLTDAELIFTPPQIALTCWRMAQVPNATGETLSGRDVIDRWLDHKAGLGSKAQDKERERVKEAATRAAAQAAARNTTRRGVTKPPPPASDADASAQPAGPPLGLEKAELHRVMDDIEALITVARDTYAPTPRTSTPSSGTATPTAPPASRAQANMEMVKAIDKRLRQCRNPEKVPGSRLWRKRRYEEETRNAEKRRKKIEASRRKDDELGAWLAAPDKKGTAAEADGKTPSGAIRGQPIHADEDEDEDEDLPSQPLPNALAGVDEQGLGQEIRYGEAARAVLPGSLGADARVAMDKNVI